MNLKFVFALVISTSINAACSGEQSRIYNQLDGNGDGYISAGEGAALEGLTEHWQILDENKDGQLNTAEFAKYEIEPIAPKEKKQY